MKQDHRSFLAFEHVVVARQVKVLIKSGKSILGYQVFTNFFKNLLVKNLKYI